MRALGRNAGLQAGVGKSLLATQIAEVIARGAQGSINGLPTVEAVISRLSRVTVASSDDFNNQAIASIALACKATLVTRNGREFSRVPGLTWVDWHSQ